VTHQTTEVIERDGYVVVEGVISGTTADLLIAAVSAVDTDSVAAVQRRGRVHAVRNLLEAVPEVQQLARSAEVRALVEPVLGPDCFVVRGILFDKTPEANWKVSWHQDLTIAVREQREVPGFGPWSEKAGIVHVQPPAEVLEQMLTVRVHLDDCGPENGPVQVIAGSHWTGRLSAEEVARWREEHKAVPCTSAQGGALVMRPLLLHASSPATVPAHRRVVHLEFAAAELPFGLQWHGRW
jgi:ectoine hydroxylase-related dioxygenase (phytanoyl-CoA dioxygenase family)